MEYNTPLNKIWDADTKALCSQRTGKTVVGWSGPGKLPGEGPREGLDRGQSDREK